MRISDWSSDVCSSDLRHGLNFAHAAPGKIILYRSAKSFAAARAVAAIKIANGAEQTILDADGAVVVEPMLESIRAHIAGAIHAPGEEVGDAYRFCVEAQRAQIGRAHV